MQKATVSVRTKKGFTLIELLIVVAIIGILAAIAIPGYIGMQEKSRKSAIVRSATSVIPELQAWMMAARSVEDIVEIDTNFNGTVETTGARVLPDDLSNANLRTAGVVHTYVTGRAGMNEHSPWNSGTSLWAELPDTYIYPPIDLAYAGRISIISGTQGIRVIARDNAGKILTNKVVTAD